MCFPYVGICGAARTKVYCETTVKIKVYCETTVKIKVLCETTVKIKSLLRNHRQDKNCTAKTTVKGKTAAKK